MIASTLRWPGRLASAALIGTIRIYQITLSPMFGDACRFEPSCSRYMVGALRKYGFIRGVSKGIHRFFRCHPWNPGGYDPP